MSDATGVGGVRGSAGAPEDELSWPAGEPERSSPATPGMSADPDDDIPEMSADPNDDIQGMSYEQARDALVEVVNELERGGTTLEQSLALWERGEALAARCESWLTGARARLEAARAGAQSRAGG